MEINMPKTVVRNKFFGEAGTAVPGGLPQGYSIGEGMAGFGEKNKKQMEKMWKF